MRQQHTPPRDARFELKSRIISMSAIRSLRPPNSHVKQTQKYRQIAASVQAVGLVELPVVVPAADAPNSYYLLDGQLRIEALRDLGATEVECIISLDDEAYTFNKRISRLAAVQEHHMIARAVERGVPEERIAAALNLSVSTIRQRFRMLDGICPEAVSLLSDKPCPMAVFNVLKRMKPLRQIQAAELLVGQNNYSSGFARSILAATHQDQLVAPKACDQDRDGAREQIARLERALEATQKRTRFVEDTYGDDNLCLTVAQTYLNRLLAKPRLVQWLSDNHADYLVEFQSIAGLTSLSPQVSARSEGV